MIKIKKATIRALNGDTFSRKINITVENKEAIEPVRQELMGKYEASNINFIYEEIDEEEVITV